MQGSDQLVTLVEGEATVNKDKQVIVSQSGILKVSGSDIILNNLNLNEGTLDMDNHSFGSKEEGGAIVLGGTDEENAAAIASGVLSENTVTGQGSGFYAAVSGVGNLTFSSAQTLNIHSTIQNTGDVTLSGADVGVGSGYGNQTATFVNDGDVIITANTVSVGVNSTIANTGDVVIGNGSVVSVEQGSTFANGGALLIQGGTLDLQGSDQLVTLVEGEATVTSDKRIVVSQSGVFKTGNDNIILNDLTLNDGTVDVDNYSLGSLDDRGAIWLGGTAEENAAALANGTLSQNVIKGDNTGIYATIRGTGDLSFAGGSLMIALHNTMEQTGDVTFEGTNMGIGNGYGRSATIRNVGDVNVTSGSLRLNWGVIENEGDINVSGGTFVADNTYIVNTTSEDGEIISEGYERYDVCRMANNGNVLISGEGALELGGNTVLDLSGADADKGIVSVGGGALVVGSEVSFTARGLEVSAGTLTAAATLNAGTLSMTGGKMLLGAGINISGSDAVTLTGGTLAVDSNVKISQAATLGNLVLGGEEGYEGSVTFAGDASFTNAITNHTNLALNGALLLAEGVDLTSGWNQNTDKGVYALESGGLMGSWYYLIHGEEGSQLSLGADTISGYSLVQDGNSASFFVANEGSAYYVLEGYSADYSAARAQADTIRLANAATLLVGDDTTVDATIGVQPDAASSVEMGSGSWLSSSSVALAEGASLSVTGSGTYVVDEAAGFESTTVGGAMSVAYDLAEGGSVTAQGHSYSGDTTIRNGVVVAGASDAFGTGAVLVEGGALQADGVSLANTVMAGAATISMAGEAPVDYSHVQVDANSLSSTAEGAALSGAHISIAQGGAYAISGVSLADSRLNINGTLTTSGDLAVQSLALSGGTLLLGGGLEVTGSTPINFVGGIVAAASDITVSQNVMLEGTTIGGESGYSGRVTFAGDASISSTLINNGTLAFEGMLSLAEGGSLVSVDMTAENGYSEGENGFSYIRYFLVQEGDGSGEKLVTVADGTMIGGSAVQTSGGNAYYDAYGSDYFVNTEASLALDGQMGSASRIIVDGVTLNISAAAPEGSTPPAIQVLNGGTLNVTASYHGSDIQLSDGGISVSGVVFGGEQTGERDTITLETAGKEYSISGSDSAIMADVVGSGNLTLATTAGAAANTFYGTLSHAGDVTLSGAVKIGDDWAGGAALSNTGDIIIDSSASVSVHSSSVISNSGALKIMGGNLKVDGSQLESSGNIIMNGGRIDLAYSLGGRKESGTLQLGGTAEDGTLSENFISGVNTGIYTDISGEGNITFESQRTLNLHSDMEHKGDVTVTGSAVDIGNSWGKSANLLNEGDVILSATSINVMEGSQIANEGDVRIESGAVNVERGTLANSGDITIASSSSLTVQASGTIANGGDVRVQGGSLALKSGATFAAKSLEVSGGGTLQAESLLTQSSVSAGAATITQAGDSAVVYTQVQVEESGISSMAEGASLSNAHISIAEGQTWTASGVQLSNSVLVIDGTLTLDAAGADGATLLDGTVLHVQKNGAIATTGESVGLFSGEHSLVVGDLSKAGLYAAYTLMSTDQLSGLVLGGDACLDVNLDGILDEFGETYHLGLVLTGLAISEAEAAAIEDAALLEDSTSRYFSLSGAGQFSITRVETDGVNTVLYIDHQNYVIPEPSTATLSLLALSALAARRRRK